MKTSHFTESQIVATLKQADAGVPVKYMSCKAGFSVATYYLSERANTVLWKPRNCAV